MTTLALKTKSELLLEGYLRWHGYAEFAFEPAVPGTTKRPDYRLRWKDQTILLEVKGLRATADDFRSGPGSFDPYAPVRKKIEAARKKFKDLDSYCCCLVLHNVDKPLVLLDCQHVYGAMLGDIGFSVPISLPGMPHPADDKTRVIFTSGGKMHRHRRGVPVEPQNQTISAILVLDRVPVGEGLFRAALQERERQIGPPLAVEEIGKECESAKCTLRDPRRRPLRVVVHENPYARVPLSRDVFTGPYDERYGEEHGCIQRLFCGAKLADLPDGPS